jgi:hypothetical protein
MFWNKKKKLKEKREKEYLELNKKFQDKHQIGIVKNIFLVIIMECNQ